MKLPYLELYIDKGTTFNKIIIIEDENTDQPINVANYSFSGQMRKSFYSSNISGNLVCTVTGASSGEVTLSMTKANTANLDDGRYFFDIVATHSSTDASSKAAEGLVIVKPTVTR